MVVKTKAAPKAKKVPKVRTKIKTIDIQAKEWYDRSYGNSYFAGRVTVNYGMKTQKVFNMPMQYGYNDMYKQQAYATLQKNGYFSEIKGNVSWMDIARLNIKVHANIQTGCKKADLKDY